MSDIAVFGIGYVGCVTAACLGRDGHHVVGVDVDSAKVAELNSGQSPISEPGLDALIREQVQAGRLSATANVADAVSRTEMASSPSAPLPQMTARSERRLSNR